MGFVEVSACRFNPIHEYTMQKIDHSCVLTVLKNWSIWHNLMYNVYIIKTYMGVCFVCLVFFVPLKNFSLIWIRHHYRWRATILDLCLSFMAIVQSLQWGYFSVLHLLWHGASVCNGHFWELCPHLIPIAQHLAVELSLPVSTTLVCRSLDFNTQPSTCGTNVRSNWLPHCRGSYRSRLPIHVNRERHWLFVKHYLSV